MWVLAGSPADRTIQEIDLDSGHILHTLPVAGSASSIAESQTGIVAVGYANGTGTVEFRSANSGALLHASSVGRPVEDLSAEGTTATFFALAGASGVAIVQALSPAGNQVPAFGVEPNAVALVAAPDGSSVFLLLPSGSVVDFPVPIGAVRLAPSSFPVGAHPLALALSGAGTTLFVLKQVGNGANVGVFNVATEEQTKVLPAPRYSVGLVSTLDGEHLYLLVGTATIGNIQVIPVG